MLAASVAALVSLAAGASSAHAARYDGWTSQSGVDPVATIADLDVDRDAIDPGDGDAPLALTYRSVEAQHVRITALDEQGRVVRTIVDAHVQEVVVRTCHVGRIPDLGHRARP